MEQRRFHLSTLMGRLRFLALGAVLTSLSAACARVTPIVAPGSVEAACERFFEGLDAMTVEAGVRDGGAARVEGAPYLRANRFLASFVQDDLSREAYAEWLERLRATDAAARRVELTRLARDAVGRVPFSPFPAWSIEQSVRECGRRLVRRDLTSPERRAWLADRIAVPDAYRTWFRVAGLYPLTRIAFDEGVSALHRDLRGTFALPLDKIPRRGSLVRYVPASADSLAPGVVAQLMAAASDNALHVSEPRADALERLYDNFAPVWEVDTGLADDRIGALRWWRGNRLGVDAGSPVVYRFASHTRFRDENLLQLNYLVWFPRRTSEHALDIYAGRLDGLIWRVTLSANGQPLAYDSIHPCGCYYQVFPGIGYRVVQPNDGAESVLSPYPLMAANQDHRLVIRVSSGRHYLQAVYADANTGQGIRYGWRDYEELLVLPHPDGQRRSLFDQEGLVGDSQRLERFVLWASGIPSPGAMRQSGTQAIALIGRRHFDDARLLERILLSL